MTIRNDHPRLTSKTTRGLEALGIVADEIGPWQARRNFWHQHLGFRPRGSSHTDLDGTTWRLLMPDEAGDVFTYRVWSSDHGMALLEPDLAGVLAAQDLHARRAGAPLRAIGSAAKAIRWTALGLWRTPAVRLVLLTLVVAETAALVVAIGLSVAP